MPPDSPPPAAAQPRRKGHGCLVALLLGVLVLIVGGYLVWRSLGGRAMVALVQDSLEAARRAEQAPGMAELRALGCQSASAMDLNEYLRLAARHFPDASVEIQGMAWSINCQAASAQAAPTCEQVALTYVRAVGGKAPAPFTATVMELEKGGTLCEVDFDEHGGLAAGDPKQAPEAASEAASEAPVPQP